VTPLLEVTGLHKTYDNGVRAVNGIDLHVDRGETLGVVGESGSGKSTAARLILRLTEPDAGAVRLEGEDVLAMRGRRLREARGRMQFVPQDPASALNPRMTVRQSIEFNLRAHRWPAPARRERIAELLDAVGLGAEMSGRRPHELSGGQVQRVALARALATRPDLVICDEPVSGLDRSVQAQVLNLLVRLQRELGVAMIFISHDLTVVEHIADRVAVMYLGTVVEEASAERLWHNAMHPYSRALLSAIPGTSGARIILEGDPPSPRAVPSGCVFSSRCAYAIDECRRAVPPLEDRGAHQRVACIRAPIAWAELSPLDPASLNASRGASNGLTAHPA
jgi:peptide/nickel transport system ATP-binding protein/oligopeptide transport system ATP-binding protein